MSCCSRVIDEIKQEYHLAVENRCREAGCEIYTSGLPSNVILKGETTRLLIRGVQPSEEKVSDYLIFIDIKKVAICIIELKSSIDHKDDIICQIQNGFNIGMEILINKSVKPSLHHVNPTLILVSKKWSESEKRQFRGRIISHSVPAYIICTDSGKYLKDFL